MAPRHSLQLVHVLDSSEVYIHRPSECLAPGRASSGELGDIHRPSDCLVPDRVSRSYGPCLVQLGDIHRPSEGLAPDGASSSDGPCPGKPGGLHPQTLRAFWPQTELQVQTALVFYNLETPTDPQRVWPQTELQVQTVHVLDNLEVYIHKLSEHLVPGRELPDPPRLGTD